MHFVQWFIEKEDNLALKQWITKYYSSGQVKITNQYTIILQKLELALIEFMLTLLYG